MFRKQVSPRSPTVFLTTKQRTKVPDGYTCRTLSKFIRRLVEFAEQRTGPSQGFYLQTEYKKRKMWTHPHTVSISITRRPWFCGHM